MRKNIAIYLASILCISAVISYAFIVYDYGFWRHDSWGYTFSEHAEFKFHLRWLAPLFHQYIRDIPQYIAWLLSISLFWYFAYAIVREHLSDTDLNNHLFAFVISSVFIINPGFLAQLNWPIHSLAAIMVLATMAFLLDKLPRLFLVIVGSIILFAILQTFAFLTLLFFIPRYEQIANKPYKDSFMFLIKNLVIWVLAILLAWVIAKAIQYLFFGDFPEIQEFRQAHPVTSFDDLFINLADNMSLLKYHLAIIYSRTGTYFLLLTLLIVAGFCFMKKKTGRAACINEGIILLGFSAAIILSIYIFTSPLGVIIPARTSLLFGPAILCVALVLLVATRSYIFVIIIMTIFLIPPYTLSYANLNWYSHFTLDVRDSVKELEEVNPRSLHGVIIDGVDFNNRDTWPLNYSDLLFGHEQIIERMDKSYELTRAFTELGYKKTYWCMGAKDLTTPECAKLSDKMVFSKCSTVNSMICSAGVTADKYWIVRF